MNTDPTADEMRAFLKAYDSSADSFDIEEAIYWFANDWHSGQWSNLYSALSTSEYHPGPIACGPENLWLYLVLKDEFTEPARKPVTSGHNQRKWK